jgi:hypothetical protein
MGYRKKHSSRARKGKIRAKGKRIKHYYVSRGGERM